MMFKSVSTKLKDNSPGFSLVELVVYTALLMIVIMFLFQFLLSVLGSESRGNAREEVINNATVAINAIDSEIRHSESIYDPASDFVSDPGQLSMLSKKDRVEGEADAYVDIFVNSTGRLCIKKETSGTQCITSEDVTVTSLDFNKIELTDLTEDGVRTSITLEYNTQDTDGKLPFGLESFSQLRNY